MTHRPEVSSCWVAADLGNDLSNHGRRKSREIRRNSLGIEARYVDGGPGADADVAASFKVKNEHILVRCRNRGGKLDGGGEFISTCRVEARCGRERHQARGRRAANGHVHKWTLSSQVDVAVIVDEQRAARVVKETDGPQQPRVRVHLDAHPVAGEHGAKIVDVHVAGPADATLDELRRVAGFDELGELEHVVVSRFDAGGRVRSDFQAQRRSRAFAGE